MNILTLCDKINLQPEIKSCVIEFANDFDFSAQRNMKKHLLSGGVSRNSYGRLKG